MAFEFNPKRPLSLEIHHLMAFQIGRIEAHLQSSDGAEKRIHDVRKRIKETRALLRLVRPVLDSQFRIENAWYRDAARELSAARDAAALIEAIDKLRKHTSDRAARRKLRQVRSALQKSAVDDAAMETRIRKLLERLPDARSRLADWPPLPDRFSTIGKGLQRCFRDGRRALESATGDPAPETFHELRKRVKDHWYHAQLLRRNWPEFMTRYAEVVEELSDALGDHHDLIVLRQTLTDEPLAYGDEASLQTTFAAIERRRQQLEKKSISIAEHVYAENPGEWTARIRAWWRMAAS